MLDPINARLASSCSRNGTTRSRHSPLASATRPYIRSCPPSSDKIPSHARQETVSDTSLPAPSNFELACAMMYLIPFDRREIFDLISHTALDDLSIRRLDESEIVDPGIGRQRRNQPDIGTFRRLDRADTAVVGRVHVPDFKARTFPGQPARTKRRQAPLMGDFRQRVRLIHKLR